LTASCASHNPKGKLALRPRSWLHIDFRREHVSTGAKLQILYANNKRLAMLPLAVDFDGW
jgi:hypothetical protein